MAAGTGVWDIQLDGAVRYHDVWHKRLILGCSQTASVVDIMRALHLVLYGVSLRGLLLSILG